MDEKDLIAKIKELSKIKPREDWVLLTKNQILGPDSRAKGEQFSVISVLRGWVFRPRMAYAFVVMLGLFISAFGFAQNSLPGDLLYPLKKITEKSQAVFVSEAEQPKVQLEMVNKRLDELTKIVEKNAVKNLAPAINETKNSISNAAKNLKKAKPDPVIISEVKKIEKKTIEIRSLGIVIEGEEEFDAALIERIKNQADILEAEKLTNEEVKILEEVKEKIGEEKYAEAWEKILMINN